MSDTKTKENLNNIRQRIEAACHSADRDPEEVQLLLATKTVPAEKINDAIGPDKTLLGENKVQELREKFSLTDNDKAEWHFIGNLQSNKINNVLPYVTCIQSVDRLKLGRELHKRLVKHNETLDILVQVNTSYENSKFGVSPENALSLIEQLNEFDTLRIKGLMTIGKFGADPEETRKCFRLLKSTQKKVIEKQYPGVKMDVLSMGMSGDLEAAIEEGATMIRVGTAVFGEREYPDSYYWDEGSSVQDE